MTFTTEAEKKKAISELYAFSNYLISVLDQNHVVSVSTILTKCDDTLIEYLESQYGKMSLPAPRSYFSSILNEIGLDTPNDICRKYDIQNNGLLYILAKVIEILVYELPFYEVKQ